MPNWNEIAEEHRTALSWSGGLGQDADGYALTPPSNDPSMSGGMNAWFAQTAQRQVNAKPRFVPVPKPKAMMALLGMYMRFDKPRMTAFYSDIRRTNLIGIRIGPHFWIKVRN